MKVSSATSVGRIRPSNEDSYFVSPPDKSDMVLAVVADGMGGHNAGEIASGKAVSILKKNVQEGNGENPRDILIRAVEKANREIYEMSIKESKFSGMGTTITACIADDNRITAAQVGDSRLYLIREDKITQITKDHSLVEMLLENGRITKEEAKHHPQKNVITRAVGTEKNVEVDMYEFTANKGDVILLCSDGLVNMVENEEILSVIISRDALDSAADKLVDAAENAGGTDNITVVLIEF
ncbi:MAG: Stp1/IreP family PP2C-type Ser/Thr phosphatase [Clostridia bacterium]|nr:Stp1/IreP family PP2C-type Ser/Thr phosphatase [Clostridia bacterium]